MSFKKMELMQDDKLNLMPLVILKFISKSEAKHYNELYKDNGMEENDVTRIRNIVSRVHEIWESYKDGSPEFREAGINGIKQYLEKNLFEIRASYQPPINDSLSMESLVGLGFMSEKEESHYNRLNNEGILEEGDKERLLAIEKAVDLFTEEYSGLDQGAQKVKWEEMWRFVNSSLARIRTDYVAPFAPGAAMPEPPASVRPQENVALQAGPVIAAAQSRVENAVPPENAAPQAGLENAAPQGGDGDIDPGEIQEDWGPNP